MNLTEDEERVADIIYPHKDGSTARKNAEHWAREIDDFYRRKNR